MSTSVLSSQVVKPSPEWFWERFRDELAAVCFHDALNSSRKWTRAVIASAVNVCRQLGDGIDVRKEVPYRLDVSARFWSTGELAVAFESELAPVGYMGRTHAKTWREEFVKLCGIPAQLRVLSTYFMPGTGRSFENFLRRQLDSMADHFHAATPGEWLLVFGSENSNHDPDQPWLPFALNSDFTLRALPLGTQPFCPRRIAEQLGQW